MAKKEEILKIVAKKDKKDVVTLDCYCNSSAGEILNIYAMITAKLIKDCPEDLHKQMIKELERQIKEYLKQ